MQMSNVHNWKVMFIDNEVEGKIIQFAEEGNKAIFDNVMPKLRDLRYGPVKKGEYAAKWDKKTLTVEQRDIVGRIYRMQTPQTLDELDKMAKGQGVYQYGVAKELRFNKNDDVRDWRHRYSHGMNVALKFWNKHLSKR